MLFSSLLLLTSFSSSDVLPSYSTQVRSEQVVLVQRVLRSYGFDKVKVTAVLDPATIRASGVLGEKFGMYPFKGNNSRFSSRFLRKVEALDYPVPSKCFSFSKVVCVDRFSRTARVFSSGRLLKTFDVRLGGSSTPTRLGVHRVFYKRRFLISDLTGTAMPFSVFFSRSQAIHFSSSFARNGYSGASLGCVNVRSRSTARFVYSFMRIGDRVLVYDRTGLKRK